MPLPLRICMVEDNPIVREVTAELLVQDRRHIVAVDTAEEGASGYSGRTHSMSLSPMSACRKM